MYGFKNKTNLPTRLKTKTSFHDNGKKVNFFYFVLFTAVVQFILNKFKPNSFNVFLFFFFTLNNSYTPQIYRFKSPSRHLAINERHNTIHYLIITLCVEISTVFKVYDVIDKGAIGHSLEICQKRKMTLQSYQQIDDNNNKLLHKLKKKTVYSQKPYLPKG